MDNFNFENLMDLNDNVGFPVTMHKERYLEYLKESSENVTAMKLKPIHKFKLVYLGEEKKAKDFLKKRLLYIREENLKRRYCMKIADTLTIVNIAKDILVAGLHVKNVDLIEKGIAGIFNEVKDFVDKNNEDKK